MQEVFDRIIAQLEDRSFMRSFKDKSDLIIRLDDAIDIIHQAKEEYSNGQWIPADEPPKDNKYVLLSFENFSTPLVGRYEEDQDGGGSYYLGDEEETLLYQDMIVNAWMPLPEPYRD